MLRSLFASIATARFISTDAIYTTAVKMSSQNIEQARGIEVCVGKIC
jgi:hypothetical protein